MIDVLGLQKAFKVSRKAGPPTHESTDPARDSDDVFLAVRDVSFSCSAGKVLGLIGPNGAGKTTTLRMLSTAIKPTRGEVKLAGTSFSGNDEEFRRRIGFLSGHTGLYARLTARENLSYFGRAYGMAKNDLNERIETLIDDFGLHDYADRQVGKLSFGMKQRIAIARTVIHSPQILILDEPTTGLDILGAQLVSYFISKYKNSGAAVIFSTHHLHEIEELCDSICVIKSGRSVFEGSVSALEEKMQEPNLHAAYLKILEN